MAFLIGSHGEDEDVLSDINITPLVDVMLVLLIIFMITAPMLHQGIEVALPKADAPNLPTKVDDPLILSINREGLVYVKEQPVHPTRLVQVLTPMLRGREDQTVFLKGDRDVPYGRVIEVLDLLHKGGIERVGMVTNRPDEPRKR
ncbi:MAG TPA: protein TolR [Thermoanaerobaculia bacterium]|nr:protein TolR [Thermoanaerobaculia bacterium]